MVEIDVENWERREHFSFFQQRLDPRLAVTAYVDVSKVLRFRPDRADKGRFTDYVYFATLKVVNEIKEFRYRLVGRRPVEFEKVHLGFTYMPKGRGLHANCFAPFEREFGRFVRNVDQARQEADAAPTLSPKGSEGQDLVYLSCLENVAFTALSNPWGDPWEDSVPRIIIGQYSSATGRMPVCVEALHSFIDGVHMGAFFKGLEDILGEPSHFA